MILNGTSAHYGTLQAYGVGTCWKIQDRRQINTKTKDNTKKQTT